MDKSKVTAIISVERLAVLSFIFLLYKDIHHHQQQLRCSSLTCRVVAFSSYVFVTPFSFVTFDPSRLIFLKPRQHWNIQQIYFVLVLYPIRFESKYNAMLQPSLHPDRPWLKDMFKTFFLQNTNLQPAEALFKKIKQI